MTANFASSNTVYTAIGMHVTDEGAANTSKLLHMTVDGESRFTIWKDGGLRISSNSSLVPGNTKLFQINDKGRDIISISANQISLGSNTVFNNTVIVGAHVESFIDVYTTDSVVTLDTTKASVFRIRSSNNYVSRIVLANAGYGIADGVIYSPNSSGNAFPAIAITLVFGSGITIPTSVWDNAKVYWSFFNTYPTSPTGNDVYVLTSTYRESFEYPYTVLSWHGVVAGQNYEIQI